MYNHLIDFPVSEVGRGQEKLFVLYYDHKKVTPINFTCVFQEPIIESDEFIRKPFNVLKFNLSEIEMSLLFYHFHFMRNIMPLWYRIKKLRVARKKRKKLVLNFLKSDKNDLYSISFKELNRAKSIGVIRHPLSYIDNEKLFINNENINHFSIDTRIYTEDKIKNVNILGKYKKVSEPIEYELTCRITSDIY